MIQTHWKVTDTLFIGNIEAADDVDLILEFKITRVVNCAGTEVPNALQDIHVQYLTYNWSDTNDQIILDENNEVTDAAFAFMEDAFDLFEGVIVLSYHGQSRSCCLVAAYLMKKFRWCLQKTMEFMNFRRPDHRLQKSFVRQLVAYEDRL